MYPPETDPKRARFEAVHVYPDMSSWEWPQHVLDGTCWCQPVITYEDPVTLGRVITHRRTIDGPVREPDPE